MWTSTKDDFFSGQAADFNEEEEWKLEHTIANTIPKITKESGSQSGLTIVVDVEKYNYMFTTTQSRAFKVIVVHT